MTSHQIEPHKITKPIQMLAVWFLALVIVIGSFLTSAAVIKSPAWICPMLSIAAVAFVPIFLIAAFVMQTKFRAHLQDDQFYSAWQERKEKSFIKFNPENEIHDKNTGKACVPSITSSEALESKRISIYEENKGLFLVHDWRPSIKSDQLSDIVLWLHQHGDGPLSQGTVEAVEYRLGSKFFEGPVVKRNLKDNFRLDISAYGPVLCIARVFIKGQANTIELTRYVNFEDAT